MYSLRKYFIVLCMGLFSVAARAEDGFLKSVDSLSEFFSSVDIEDIYDDVSKNVQGVYDSVKVKLEKNREKWRKEKKQDIDDSAKAGREDSNIDIFDPIKSLERLRIRYPHWWGKKPGAFSKALSILDYEKCFTFKCYNLDLAESIIKASEAEYHTLYNKLKNKDTRCAVAVLQPMNIIFQHEHIPKQCLKKGNHSHKVCRDILNYIDVAKQRFLDIVELAYGGDVLPSTESMAICHECVSSKEEPTMQDILNLQDTLKAATAHQPSCKELKPGEEKTVTSGTGITNIPYKVKREEDGSYTIPLFLSFSADEDYDGPVARGKVPDYYMKKAQKCIARVGKNMLGPNGEKLKIAVQKPSC